MKKKDFNQGWLFGAVGKEPSMQPVTLPHDAMLYEKRSKDAATAGACGYFPGGAYVYVKRFLVPETWRTQSAVLEFEAVYQNAQVFVNDALVAEQRYGYTNFFVVLDPQLKYGEENEIKVIADNSSVPNSRWYSGSGIYRNVNLFLGDKSHIRPDGLLVSTSGNDAAHVKVSVTGGDTVRVSVLDGEKVVAQAEAAVKEGTASADIPVSQPRLWDAEHPELYRCRAELLKNGEMVDEADAWFGFRTLSWSTRGFFVNGKKTLLRGACVHHDNGILVPALLRMPSCAVSVCSRRPVSTRYVPPTTLPPRRCWMPVTGWVCMSWMNSATTGWYIKTPTTMRTRTSAHGGSRISQLWSSKTTIIPVWS